MQWLNKKDRIAYFFAKLVNLQQRKGLKWKINFKKAKIII